MAMNLKNYTTEVPASRSIDNIEKLLVDFGAFNIMKEYKEYPPLIGKRCSSISFIVEVDNHKMPFRLPANCDKLAAWLRNKKPNSSDKIIAEQAERIAWKQQYELLHLQLGQIEMNQMEKLEVLFPLLYDVQKEQTYYQKIKASGFKGLLTV
jgi:hypothetical protein